MSNSIGAMEANFVRVGTLYVPEPLLALFLQFFQPQTPRSTAPMPGTATEDKNASGIPGPSVTAPPSITPGSEDRTPFSPPSAAPATSAAPSTTPGITGEEGHDSEGGPVAAAAGREAPPTAPRAEDDVTSLPARPSRARGLRWRSRQRRRRPMPYLPGPIKTRALDTANKSAGMAAPAPSAKTCATCGTPGVRTAAWVCGVCGEPFLLGGEPVLSLDGLAADLAAGGLHCESCEERRPPFERLACSGCSSPRRRLADVLAHDSRERDRGSRAAEISVDAPVELPDGGITTDPEIEALLPRVSVEEHLLLEQDLLAHGCLSPLVVWQDGPRQVLLDGHIRRAICQTRHIPFERKILEFADRASAMAWVLKHQLGRRNLTPEAQAYLRGRIYNLEKRQGARTDLDTSRQSGEKLSELLADVYKVGSRTIERDGQFAAHLDHLAVVYGTTIKNAVLTRDAKMSRAEVARAASLDASARDRILVRIGQGEAAVDMIREAIRERAVKDPQARTAEADEDAGQAEASASLRDSQGRAEEPRDSAPPASGPPFLHDASHLDEHPISVELRRLAAAVRDLKEGELDAFYVRRLLQWLFEIQQALAARSQVRAGGDEQHALARERASNAAAGSPHRAFDGDEPGRVKNAIEVPLG